MAQPCSRILKSPHYSSPFGSCHNSPWWSLPTTDISNIIQSALLSSNKRSMWHGYLCQNQNFLKSPFLLCVQLKDIGFPCYLFTRNHVSFLVVGDERHTNPPLLWRWSGIYQTIQLIDIACPWSFIEFIGNAIISHPLDYMCLNKATNIHISTSYSPLNTMPLK